VGSIPDVKEVHAYSTLMVEVGGVDECPCIHRICFQRTTGGTVRTGALSGP
jgi:hypothetical protein